MDYKKLNRLDEDHENDLPAELLNMTVGEMLDKAAEADTKGNASYEVIEDALRALTSEMDGGYEADEIPFNAEDTIEKPDEVKNTDIEDEEDKSDDMPTYDDITAKSVASKGEGVADFKF